MADANTPVPAGKERRAPVVMLVDDEPANLELMAGILVAHGYDVFTADSGTQALARGASRQPDLAIFDLKMPGIDGVSLCRRFRETPALAAVPVIFVTAAADQEDLIRCFEAGAVDFLAKPIRIAELLQRVRTHLELKFSRDRLVHKIRDCDVLTAMVAHDLKSPLASIRFSVQMLAEEPGLRAERVQDLLSSIIDATGQTLAFIEDFLGRNAAASIVSIDAFRPFVLNELLQSVVVRHFEHGFRKDIRIEVDAGEPIEAFADPLAAEHVVDNLLSNALKFAPPGSNVSIAIDRGDPGSARVRIADRGPGIDEADRKRLFQRYTRLSARPTWGESSTGLGLSIAKQLADMMQGNLTHEARDGGGSIFVFELPTRPMT